MDGWMDGLQTLGLEPLVQLQLDFLGQCFAIEPSTCENCAAIIHLHDVFALSEPRPNKLFFCFIRPVLPQPAAVLQG